MIELINKAANYAAEKTNEVMTTAIAQAYADGYRDGYKDREEEIPVDLRGNKTEFVDLGLPSGTLWSTDYKKDGDELKYLPYEIAASLQLPTEEQWNELKDNCKWHYELTSFYDQSRNDYIYPLTKAYCVGPNGNTIEFQVTGYIKIPEKVIESDSVWFWLNDENNDNEKNAITIYNSQECYNSVSFVEILKTSKFSGYKLPVRLVRNK